MLAQAEPLGRDRQVTSDIPAQLLSHSRTDPRTPTAALLQIWDRPLQPQLGRLGAGGRGWQKGAPPHALSKALSPACSHLHHAQLQSIEEEGIHGHIEDVGCDPCHHLRHYDLLEAKEELWNLLPQSTAQAPSSEHKGDLQQRQEGSSCSR